MKISQNIARAVADVNKALLAPRAAKSGRIPGIEKFVFLRSRHHDAPFGKPFVIEHRRVVLEDDASGN